MVYRLTKNCASNSAAYCIDIGWKKNAFSFYVVGIRINIVYIDVYIYVHILGCVREYASLTSANIMPVRFGSYRIENVQKKMVFRFDFNFV